MADETTTVVRVSSAFKLVFLTVAALTLIMLGVSMGLTVAYSKPSQSTSNLIEATSTMCKVGFGAIAGLFGGIGLLGGVVVLVPAPTFAEGTYRGRVEREVSLRRTSARTDKPGRSSKTRRVGGDDSPVTRDGRRSDDEVVGTPLSAGATHVGEERCMDAGNGEVIPLDEDGAKDVSNELLPLWTAAPVGKLHADEQLRRGDRGDGNIVLVIDNCVQPRQRSAQPRRELSCPGSTGPDPLLGDEDAAKFPHLASPAWVWVVRQERVLQSAAAPC